MARWPTHARSQSLSRFVPQSTDNRVLQVGRSRETRGTPCGCKRARKDRQPARVRKPEQVGSRLASIRNLELSRWHDPSLTNLTHSDSTGPIARPAQNISSHESRPWRQWACPIVTRLLSLKDKHDTGGYQPEEIARAPLSVRPPLDEASSGITQATTAARSQVRPMWIRPVIAGSARGSVAACCL